MQPQSPSYTSSPNALTFTALQAPGTGYAVFNKISAIDSTGTYVYYGINIQDTGAASGVYSTIYKCLASDGTIISSLTPGTGQQMDGMVIDPTDSFLYATSFYKYVSGTADYTLTGINKIDLSNFTLNSTLYVATNSGNSSQPAGIERLVMEPGGGFMYGLLYTNGTAGIVSLIDLGSFTEVDRLSLSTNQFLRNGGMYNGDLFTINYHAPARVTQITRSGGSTLSEVTTLTLSLSGTSGGSQPTSARSGVVVGQYMYVGGYGNGQGTTGFRTRVDLSTMTQDVTYYLDGNTGHEAAGTDGTNVYFGLSNDGVSNRAGLIKVDPTTLIETDRWYLPFQVNGLSNFGGTSGKIYAASNFYLTTPLSSSWGNGVTAFSIDISFPTSKINLSQITGLANAPLNSLIRMTNETGTLWGDSSDTFYDVFNVLSQNIRTRTYYGTAGNAALTLATYTAPRFNGLTTNGIVYTGSSNGTLAVQAPVANGTYTVGDRITPVTGALGTITITNGVITAIQQAT